MVIIMSIGKYFKDSIAVATSPNQFYRDLPKAGGLIDPAIFVLLMAVVAVLLCAVGALFNAETSFFGTIIGGLIPHIIKVFVVVAIAAIALYFLWQRLGSAENFETSARAVAYLAVFSPIWVVLGGMDGIVGLLAKLIFAVWLIAVMVAASSEVHRVDKQSALISFAGLAVLIALFCYLSEDDVIDKSSLSASLPVTQKADNLPKLSEDQLSLDQLLDDTAESLVAPLQQDNKDKSALAGSDHNRAIDQVVEQEILGNQDVSSVADIVGDLANSDLANKELANKGLGSKDLDIEGLGNQGLGIEEKAEKAGEALGNLVNELDESVGKVGEQLASAAKDFKAGLDKEEPSAADEEDTNDAAAELHSDEDAGSLAESAGASLGAVIEGMGDIVSGVQEGFKKTLDDQSSEPADNAEQAPPTENNDLATPEELGVAMGEFMRAIDRATADVSEGGETAAEALGRFLDSYKKALDQGESGLADD